MTSMHMLTSHLVPVPNLIEINFSLINPKRSWCKMWT